MKKTSWFWDIMLGLCSLLMMLGACGEHNLKNLLLAGAVFSVNMLFIFFFRQSEPEWKRWISERAERIRLNGKIKPEDSFENLMFFADLTVFGEMIPYFLFPESSGRGGETASVVSISLLVWVMLYPSKLHCVITNSMTEKWKIFRLPLITLGFMIWLDDRRRLVDGSRQTARMILVVFAVDIFLDLLARMYIRRIRNE